MCNHAHFLCREWSTPTWGTIRVTPNSQYVHGQSVEVVSPMLSLTKSLISVSVAKITTLFHVKWLCGWCSLPSDHQLLSCWSIHLLLLQLKSYNKDSDNRCVCNCTVCPCLVVSMCSHVITLLPIIGPSLHFKWYFVHLQYQQVGSPFKCLFRSRDLELPSLPPLTLSSSLPNGSLSEEDHLKDRPLRDVYFWWCLAGGDLQGEIHKKGLVKTRPAILNLPWWDLNAGKCELYTNRILCWWASLVTKEGKAYGLERDSVTLYDPTVIQLSLDQLKKVFF